MKRLLVGACLITLAARLPASAQEMVIDNTNVRFTFADPSRVGIRQYSMGATTLDVAVPLGERLVAGLSVGHVRAGMDVPSSDLHHSGWTDAEVSLGARFGPLSLRGGASLDVGSASGSSGANAVVGLAAYDVLPFPARSWGRGGGFSLAGTVPLRIGDFDLRVAGGWRTHGAYTPFADDQFDYHLGSERLASVQLGRQTSALSRLDVGALWVSPSPDRVTRRSPFPVDAAVFEPGRRIGLYAVVQYTLGRTGAHLRGDIYSRQAGSVAQSASTSATPIEGIATPLRRSVASLQLATRTLAHPFPLLFGVALRSATPEGDASASGILSADAGTEIEVRGPWRGRAFVSPTFAIHRGRIGVADGATSSVGGWQFHLNVRWSGS